MREGKEVSPGRRNRAHEALVERAIEAAAKRPREERPRTALEAIAELAEADPEAVRAALHSLRGDRAALERLEACLCPADPDQATLRLGAAIQQALQELASPTPNLKAQIPDLLRWLDP